MVFDPLPPGSGDAHLIPSEYYVSGPYGGHWRDYWVPRVRETGFGSKPPEPQQLRVGYELEPTSIVYPSKEDVAKAAPTGGHELSKKERDRAEVAAREGLEAVRAIARNTPGIAAQLGMGGNFIQVFGPALVARFSSDKALKLEVDREAEIAAAAGLEGLAGPETAKALIEEKGELKFGDFGFKPLSSDERLELGACVPVHDLVKAELETWDGEDFRTLLGEPTKVIWEVVRPAIPKFPFFSTVTVRKENDEWKLVSIGRQSLAAAIAGKQLSSGLKEFKGLRGLVDVLRDLGMLNPLLGVMPNNIVVIAAALLGYTKEEAVSYAFVSPRQKLDEDRLKRLEILTSVLELRCALEEPADSLFAAGAAANPRPKLSAKAKNFLKTEEYRAAHETIEVLKARAEQFEDDVSEVPPSGPDLDLEKLEKLVGRATNDRLLDDPAITAPRPAFVLEIKQLYQLFVSYEKDYDKAALEKDLVKGVYPEAFHRPGSRVRKGTLLEVLRDLQKVALGIDIPQEA